MKRSSSGWAKRVLCAWVCLWLGATGWATEPTAGANSRRVLLLGNAHYPPFIELHNGQPTGLAVDLLQAVLEKGEVAGDFEAREWQHAQSAVRAGRADALVLINKNPEREAYLDFSAPFITSEFVFFRKSDRIDIIGPESLPHKTVGVERGGYTTSIMRRFPLVRLHEVKDLNEGFALLAQGGIDALITERWAGMYELSRREVAGIALIGQAVETSTSYLAVRKGDKALLEQLNRGLERIDRDGARQAILDRWSGKQVLYLTREQVSYYRITQALAAVIIALLCFMLWYGRKLARDKRVAIEQHNAELEQRVAQRTRSLLTARAEAERAAASRSQFLANASHELRTPLQGILGFALIGRQRFDELSRDELQECFDHITESGQRMHRVVESLLALADMGWKEHRSVSDQFTESIALRGLLEECIAAQQAAAGRKRQRIVVQHGAVAAQIAGDATRLRQVFDNLIDNAIRYARADSCITLTTRDTTLAGSSADAAPVAAVAITVLDEGPGIPVAELDRIFDPFFRGKNALIDKGGAGLGLPLCRGIVEQHGGTLQASNGPQGGAAFEVCLPCAEHGVGTSQPKVTAGPEILDPSVGLAQSRLCAHDLLEVLCSADPRAPTHSHEQCAFGQWLAGPGQPFSLFQEYQVLTQTHAQLHTLVNRVQALYGQGQDDAAQQLLDAEFAATSTKIQALLGSFKLD